MQVQSLGWEDPLEQEMAPCSCITCLGNSMDRGAWQATVVHGTHKQPDMTEHRQTPLFCEGLFLHNPYP